VSVDHAKQPVPALSGDRPPVLTVRGVAASYGPRQVLRNVSFDVTAGRCTAVVGQSGSGKTTLARSLVGLHTDWTGEVQLSGTKLSSDPRRRSKEDRRIMQYVFQNPYGSLNPRMSVRKTSRAAAILLQPFTR
jgi:peptide/nickel transport system ATP-binding protein